MNIRIEQMKKKLKASKNLENDKLIVKKILDADKAAIDKINKDIEKIRLTLADDYIPVPLYRMISQPSKKEKLNLDIKENTMLIKVKNLTYTKSNPLIMLAIRGDDININKEIKGKNPEDINEEFTWVFNEKDFKNLVKYSIEIALGRTYSIKSTKVKGRGELPLRKLKSLSSLDEAVKLKMESGKPDKSIDIEIILRTPFIDKEYEDDFKEVVNIIKTSLNKMTLAIGDGANDVAMIQKAHIGIGIIGREGTQAMRASDYAILEFKFLKTLLCVHGRYSLLRVSKMVYHSFYKNIVFTLIQFFLYDSIILEWIVGI